MTLTAARWHSGDLEVSGRGRDAGSKYGGSIKWRWHSKIVRQTLLSLSEGAADFTVVVKSERAIQLSSIRFDSIQFDSEHSNSRLRRIRSAEAVTVQRVASRSRGIGNMRSSSHSNSTSGIHREQQLLLLQSGLSFRGLTE